MKLSWPPAAGKLLIGLKPSNQVLSVDNEQPVFDIMTMQQRLAKSVPSKFATKMSSQLTTAFNIWADRLLAKEYCGTVVAYNFNLYEHEGEFAIQLVGTSSFDISNEDWACDEVFSSGEDLFHLSHEIVGDQWERGLRTAKSLVRNYLDFGKHAAVLKGSRGVGVAFVDGSIDLVYVRRNP